MITLLGWVTCNDFVSMKTYKGCLIANDTIVILLLLSVCILLSETFDHDRDAHVQFRCQRAL